MHMHPCSTSYLTLSLHWGEEQENGRDFYGNMLNGEKLGYEEKQLALGCFL
jgi:hypothetical protein